MHLCKLGVGVSLAVLSAAAQSFVASVPRASQRATAGQRVALTDIKITYHRPLVGGRKVWGGIVPYGDVWRAGANENTTIEFSDPVMVEDHELAKGVYGLHMIPTQESWTVIFSKNSTSWGSFTYKQDEDALRVTVKPAVSEFREALAYDFDDVKPDSATVTLRWEKVAVPIRVSVPHEVTVQHLRNQMRDLAQYNWEGLNEAASCCLQTKVNLDEALQWSDRSIQTEERFENLMTKAGLLTALSRSDAAVTARTRALEIGNATQVYFYGRQLQGEKKKAEAINIFRTVAKRFPQHWLGHMAQARVYAADGDFTKAVQEVKAAEAAGAPDQQKPNIQTLIKRLENKEDING